MKNLLQLRLQVAQAGLLFKGMGHAEQRVFAQVRRHNLQADGELKETNLEDVAHRFVNRLDERLSLLEQGGYGYMK